MVEVWRYHAVAWHDPSICCEGSFGRCVEVPPDGV